MRRSLSIIGALLLTTLAALGGPMQQDPLEGRWEGMVESMQGKRPAAVTFKRAGDAYTGTVTGLQSDIPFKEIKVAEDQVTARAVIESPQGSFDVKYKFTVQGETLKGQGEVEFGGQTYAFTYDMKRVSHDPAAAPQHPQQAQQQQMQSSPQPRQKQSLDYFAGRWNFRWIGMDSPLGPGTREGVVTFSPGSGGKSLESHAESSADGVALKESGVVSLDEQKKLVTMIEHRANGVEISTVGDWSVPIAIRFAPVDIKVKGQTLRLKRTINIVSAFSFTVVEELSTDGGPFHRLGNGLFTKIQ
jgi:hypothetical protein